MEMEYESKWKAEIAAMKRVLADLGLTEAKKWGKPTFMLGDHNIVILQGFKEWFGLGFFQGALVKDPKKILVQLGSVQSGRVMRFENAKEITANAKTIQSYVRAAIAVAKSGAKVEKKKTSDFAVPPELTSANTRSRSTSCRIAPTVFAGSYWSSDMM